MKKLAYFLVPPNEDIMPVPVGNEAIVSQLTLGFASFGSEEIVPRWGLNSTYTNSPKQ